MLLCGLVCKWASSCVCVHERVFVPAWVVLPDTAWVVLLLFLFLLFFLFFFLFNSLAYIQWIHTQPHMHTRTLHKRNKKKETHKKTEKKEKEANTNEAISTPGKQLKTRNRKKKALKRKEAACGNHDAQRGRSITATRGHMFWNNIGGNPPHLQFGGGATAKNPWPRMRIKQTQTNTNTPVVGMTTRRATLKNDDMTAKSSLKQTTIWLRWLRSAALYMHRFFLSPTTKCETWVIKDNSRWLQHHDKRTIV